jgi:hypothetical protein
LEQKHENISKKIGKIIINSYISMELLINELNTLGYKVYFRCKEDIYGGHYYDVEVIDNTNKKKYSLYIEFSGGLLQDFIEEVKKELIKIIEKER